MNACGRFRHHVYPRGGVGRFGCGRYPRGDHLGVGHRSAGHGHPGGDHFRGRNHSPRWRLVGALALDQMEGEERLGFACGVRIRVRVYGLGLGFGFGFRVWV